MGTNKQTNIICKVIFGTQSLKNLYLEYIKSKMNFG